MTRPGSLFLLPLLVALAVPAAGRPQALVVAADHLTLADVMRPGLPNLARMRAGGQMALMSPGLAAGDDPVANVYATLGAGDSIRVGDVSQGRLAAALRLARVRTALIGDADGDDTGVYRPASWLLPLADEAHVGRDDGTIPDPIACGGKRIDPERLWRQTQDAFQRCDLVVVHDGDFARAERENRRGDLLPQAYLGHRGRALAALDGYLGLALASSGRGRPVFMIVPTAPFVGSGWDRLTPVLRFSRDGRETSACLRSDTTQTEGLIAVRDIAPTLLSALNIRPPIQMTGAILRVVPAGTARAVVTLGRLDRLTRLNQDAQNPLFWSLGSGAAVVICAGMGLFLSGRMAADAGARRAGQYGLRLLSAWPLALLLAPLADPAELGTYFGWIIGLTAALALLPSPSLIYAVTTAVLLADGLTGTRLVSQSVLSAYALSGIRFYGIGNEYMGLLIGGGLLLASCLPGASAGRLGDSSLVLWFAFVTFALSCPAFGAKAGGAITATATFVMAWRGLHGLPVRWTHGLGGVLGGFALVFLWALPGHWLPMRHTHIDTAVGAVEQGRLGYIAGVAMRKVGLAARVFLHPGTLLGVLGLTLIAAAGRLFLWTQVSEYLSRHPRFAAVWKAGLWGCLIAVLFNDSGVVAAALLLTCLSLTLLHGLYQECALLPSTSAKSVSALPSVTP